MAWVATAEDGSVCAVVEMEPDAGDWTVFNVAVGPLFQGKGLGPYMLAFAERVGAERGQDRKSTRLNSSHITSSYAVFCLKENTMCR